MQLARFNILKVSDSLLKARLGEAIAEILLDYVRRKYPEFRIGNLMIIRTDKFKHIVSSICNLVSWVNKLKGEEYTLSIFRSPLEEISKKYEVGLEPLVELLKNLLEQSAAKDSGDSSDSFQGMMSDCIALRAIKGHAEQSYRRTFHSYGTFIHLRSISEAVHLVVSDILSRLCPYFDPKFGTCTRQNIHRCVLARRLEEKFLEDSKLRDKIVKEIIELAPLRGVMEIAYAYGNDCYRMVRQMVLKGIFEEIVKAVYYNVPKHSNGMHNVIYLGRSSQPHIDYLGIDGNDNLWTFELKTTTTGGVTFSEPELRTLKRLRELGVKCGVIKVILHGCWDVTLELELME